MQSKATTVQAYLSALPDDRRKALEALRKVIRANLPRGYQETIQYGMIGYSVPHSVYPAGYHCDPKQPLPFASIASQKNHLAIYLFCIYCDPKEQARFVTSWKKAGHKLDMGKGCVRFKRLEDVPLDVVGDAISRIPVDAFVAAYEAALSPSARAKHEKHKAKLAGAAPAARATKKAPAKEKAATKAPAKKVAARKAAAKKAPARKKAAKKR